MAEKSVFDLATLDEGSELPGGSDGQGLCLPLQHPWDVGSLPTIFLTKVLFSLGTGWDTGDMWTHIPGGRWTHLWSHLPGRQHPVNQDDHLWHKEEEGGDL